MVRYLVTKKETHVKCKLKNFWLPRVAFGRQNSVCYLKAHVIDRKCPINKCDVCEKNLLDKFLNFQGTAKYNNFF